MNIILSLLFAIKMFYPVQIELPEINTVFPNVKSHHHYKAVECIDDDNRDCLFFSGYSTERKVPYLITYYFNDENILIQTNIVFYNTKKVDISKIGSEGTILDNNDNCTKLTIDEDGNTLFIIYACNGSSDEPAKKGMIPKLPELKK